MRTTVAIHRMACLCALGILLQDPARAAEPTRLLQPDDYYRLQTVSDVELSPDGRWVAYTLSTPNRKTDRDDGDIWLVSYDGSKHIQLTSSQANDHSPHFSADGQTLAFLRDPLDGKSDPQVWLIDLPGGEARQLSHFEGTISTFAFAPDGRHLAFSGLESPRPAPDPDRPAPIVVDRLQFRADGYGFLGNEHAHLYLLDLASGQASALTSGAYDELQPVWSPDGKQLAFLTKRGADPDETNNWDVYVMPAQAGAAARQITRNPGTEGDPDALWSNRTPQFSPDGQLLTYEAGGRPEDIWYAQVQVGLANVAGTLETTPAAALDRNCIDEKFSRDGRYIYFRLEDNHSMVLARLRLSDGDIERLSPPGHVVNEYDVGADGHTVLVYTTANLPPEIYALDKGKLHALTHHNAEWLAHVDIGSYVPLEFPSADGLRISALLLTPPGPPPPAGWPTVVRLHGGPDEQHQYDFFFDWQLLRAAGYAVLAPDTRGSNGYGYAFQKLLFGKWGQVDVPDVLAAADYAVAHHIADPNRLGIGGWSYGSLLTNYVIVSDHRFRAATSGGGEGNMLAGYGTDHYVREWEIELGLPWQNTSLWIERSSPFLHADRITTPTLFLGCELDSNVPLTGAEQMYEALRRLHVPTELIIYPGEYHDLDRPSFLLDRIRRYIDWYDRYLKQPGTGHD
jgi:dipeptidyl aminopeptidase/acylaminoacyl peptidase